LIKNIFLEENFKWHLEAFASELFIWHWGRTWNYELEWFPVAVLQKQLQSE